MEARQFTDVRTQLRLSQSAIATALGVDQGTISRWEAGKARIPASMELALAKLIEKAPAATPLPRILVADPVAAEGVEMLRGVGEVEVRTGLAPTDLIAA